MAKKATHQGECQLCGRRQMLPGGRMAHHGYTVEWGFFQGVCPGSKHLPYEMSADLLPARIEWARAEVLRLEEYAVATETMTDHVWLSLYLKKGWNSRRGREDRGYEDVKVPVASLVRLTEWKIGFRHERAERTHEEHVRAEDLAAFVAERNAREAKSIRARRDQVAGYLKWAEARLAAWVLAPEKLSPVVEAPAKPKVTCDAYGCRRHRVAGYAHCYGDMTDAERADFRARRKG